MLLHKFEKGKAYFIRTVTHHYIGKVVDVREQCVIVNNCVWVADDGRFHKFLKGEWDESSEREPYPPELEVMVFFGAMVDASEWKHEIPTDPK
jgi:hypothetical protein